MTEAHYITKIFVVYNNKVIRKNLKFTDSPNAEFIIDEEFTTLEAYEYCNVHGLWKTTYNK
jgi:superoxide reductase